MQNNSPALNRTKLVDCAKIHLKQILDEAKVPESHGLQHAEQVLNHMQQALDSNDDELYNISETRKLSCVLAALLHDADDRKYFKPQV
jgi:hypothetical protein